MNILNKVIDSCSLIKENTDISKPSLSKTVCFSTLDSGEVSVSYYTKVVNREIKTLEIKLPDVKSAWDKIDKLKANGFVVAGDNLKD